MNYQTLFGLIVRHALSVAGGALVTKGIVTGEQLPQLVEVVTGGVLTVGAVGWSVINKKLQGLLRKK